jgi:hypothetical protein
MTKIWIPFLVLFQLSCSSRQQFSSLDELAKTPGYKLKKIEVASQKEARTWMQNQLNFVTMLFQQSRDPYYGVPKWSDECMKENKIGHITENPKGLQVVSELYLSEQGFPGLCSTSTGATRSFIIYIYCQETTFVQEIRIPWGKNLSSLATDLCL